MKKHTGGDTKHALQDGLTASRLHRATSETEEVRYRNQVMRKRLIGHYMLLGIVVMVAVNLLLYLFL
ncbi:hypothetical protein HMF8227_00338 [Saliniradius amylolyticus]|uniref:Uncharacterized protein n=1 Tax=Saliniradius amylolyticus TaxID=2183582 RepID=A0A2S2DZL8_9ALTE|nr:hypothetical protein HMF8227_00338 [Saliniradius amylolyticus]